MVCASSARSGAWLEYVQRLLKSPARPKILDPSWAGDSGLAGDSGVNVPTTARIWETLYKASSSPRRAPRQEFLSTPPLLEAPIA